MSSSSIVRKLMLPIEEYATIHENKTLQEALVALHEAQKHLRPGSQPHRALFVEHSNGVFVGLLGYQAILAALRPKQLSIELDENLRRAGVSDDMVATSLASMHFFQEDLPSLCDRACNIKLRDLFLSKPKTIDVDAPLHELLDAFAETNIPSMLVVEKGDVIGVIRVSDLFDEVTRVVLEEHDGTCAEND